MTSGEAQTLSRLTKFIEKRKPMLWAGAGLSIPAGYPSTWQLANDLWDQFADDDKPELDDAYALVDSFHAQYGHGDLGAALAKLISAGKPPTASHAAISRLAKAGKFPKLITTNYDDLLETALNNAGAPFLKQVLDRNDHITDDDYLRLMKIHGEMGDWKKAILTGQAYADFGKRFGFLVNQLDIELVQRPILFVGCSMLDQRILDWLHQLTDAKAKKIKSWRALLTTDGVKALKEHTHAASGQSAWDLLQKVPFEVYHLPDFETLPKWLTTIARKLAPPDLPQGEWVLHFKTNGDVKNWTATFDGRALALDTLPFEDEGFLGNLRQLEELVHLPLPCDASGNFASNESQIASAMIHLAQTVGERLAAMLDKQARNTLNEAMNANTQTMLRIRAEGPGADRILALPWELLFWDDRFPVKDIRLDLVREVVVANAAGLDAGVTDFKVLVHIAAPEAEDGRGALDYEQEAYRLVLAMEQAAEKEVIFSDLGTVRDLIQSLKQVKPTVLHFTGHGLPGELIFENDDCEDVRVKIADLMTQIRAHAPNTLPQLFYLASCHGASQHAKKHDLAEFRQLSELGAVAGKGPSSAVTLQREGCPAVLAYFGPVGDQLSTGAEVAFYAGLKEGKSLCESIRSARYEMGRALTGDHGHYRYPLGWAQLSLYLRGSDAALCDGKTSGSGHYALEQALFREDQPVQSLNEFREKGKVAGFIGRRKAMALLRKRYAIGTRIFVLHGMGGIGKTTLALEWIARLGIEPKRVIAINAQSAKQSPDPVENLWTQVIGHLQSHFPEEWQVAAADTAKALNNAATLRAFAKTMTGPWLIYIDNAESLQEPLDIDEGAEVGEGAKGKLGRWASDALAAWWQQLASLAKRNGNLALVATTRYVWPGLGKSECWPVGVLRNADMLRMMRWFPTLRRMPLDHKRAMVKWLDGHARALVYLESLLRDELGDPAPEEKIPETRWQKVIDQAIKGTEKKLVTEDLMLEKLWQRLDEPSQRHLHALTVLRRPAPKAAIAVLGERMDRLEAMGLLTKFQGEMRGLHAVVYQFVAKQAGHPNQDHHLKIGRWYKAQFEGDGRLFSAEEAIYHLMTANAFQEAAKPAVGVAKHYRETLRFNEAQDLLNQLIPCMPAGESLEQLLNVRGNLHNDLGLFTKSEVDFRAMLASAENRQKAAEWRGRALHGLANALTSLGRYEEAVPAFKASLEIDRELHHENHPSYASSLAGLANALTYQGSYEEAVGAFTRALEIQHLVYESETHPQIAATLSGLGRVLRILGQYEDAIVMYLKSLEIRTKVYGREDHPDMLPARTNLALALSFLDKIKEARQQMEKALKIARGMEHPYHLGSILTVYAQMEVKDSPAKALLLATEAEYELKKVFQADHPTVQEVRALIARLSGKAD